MRILTTAACSLVLAIGACDSPTEAVDAGADQSAQYEACPGDIHEGLACGTVERVCQTGSFNRFRCQGGVWSCYDPEHPCHDLALGD